MGEILAYDSMVGSMIGSMIGLSTADGIAHSRIEEGQCVCLKFEGWNVRRPSTSALTQRFGDGGNSEKVVVCHWLPRYKGEGKVKVDGTGDVYIRSLCRRRMLTVPLILRNSIVLQ